MAYPLACFLNESGSDNGFDVDAELIAWANDTIGAARRNFHFEHADVRNRHYSAAGKLTPESFRFPAPSWALIGHRRRHYGDAMTRRRASVPPGCLSASGRYVRRGAR